MTFQGSGAPTADGDYVSSTGGLDTFYRFFIEVPPGLPRLVVELFDPDVGVGGLAEAAQGRDRTRTGFTSSVEYTLIRPDGTTAATLHCDSATCLDDAWQTLLDSTTATNTAAGHWELRVDMSSTRTTGDDINALGIRANDGTSGSGGTELNIYAESPYAFGVNPAAVGVNSRTYTVFPYITSGCSCSENDFDYDSNQGDVGSILLLSPTMAFTQTIASTALSANDVWARNTLAGWTSDDQAGDYGVWQASVDIKSYVDPSTGQNGNLANLYFGNFQAAANPPSSNSPSNAFRIYLPTDSGTAPLKPYVEQSAARFSGPNPPAVGQTTKATITIRVVNPTSAAITFSSTHLVTSQVPGAGVVYEGNARVDQGALQSQPAVGGAGGISWNPGTLAAQSFATLTYQVQFTPTAAFQRLPLTGTPASGNGTRAQYVDETGNTTQARATYQFGPLCEVAATQGSVLPCGTILSTISGGGPAICPGDSSSLTVTITGGTFPYTVNLSNGDTKTGTSPLTFTVTPTSTQGYSVSSGFDSAGCPISASFSTVTVTVRPAIAVATTNVNPACPGSATGSITVNASGGAPPFMFSDDGGSTFQTSSTFTNLAAGTYTLVVKDNSNCTKTSSATLTDPSPISFTVTAGNPLCAGTATGSIVINASGGTGALQYSDDSGTLFQTSNTFSNLPAGTYHLVVKDAKACTSTAMATLTDPAAITFTTVNVSPSCFGASTGSITVTASGGAGTLVYSDNGGASYQASSLFSNLAAGPYSLVVKDANGCTKTSSVTLTAPPLINFTTTNVNPVCPGTANGSITVTASGGTGTLTYSDDGGTSFQGSNAFSNLAAGTYSLVVKDGNGCSTGPSPVTLNDPAQIVVGPGFIPPGTQGVMYPATTFTQTNGTGAVSFAETGPLPTGLTFSSCVLSGTPTQTGSFPMTITATDQNGCTGSRGYILTIACTSSTIAVGPASIPPGTVNTPYAGATFTGSGGTGAYTLIEAGALPTGITFSNGTLAGTPTQSGVFPITVAATDANGCSGETNYMLVIPCNATTITVSPGTLADGTAGTSYSPVSFSASGGSGPYTLLLAGSLPAGMAFSGGTLSGTPTQTGSFSFTVAATDANGCGGDTNYTLTIDCPAITVNPGSLPSSVASSQYPTTTFTQTGRLGTVSFSESGALPAGLTFNNATATLSGTPSQPGNFPITVTATDSNGCTGRRNYTIVITCEMISVSPNSVSAGTAGAVYGPVTFTQTGGIGVTTFSETGTLPTGLTLSTGGVLSGTPTQTGSFPITVTATDSNGCTGSAIVTVVVNCQTIIVNPTTIPSGTAGAAYTTTTFTQSGGIGAVTFSESGALPTGLSFSAGVLSGTPLQTGSFPITVTATDSNGCTGSRNYSLAINCPIITVNPATLSAGTAGVAYGTVTFTQTGGVGTTTFSETGALPNGLSFSAGVLSGTPTQTGTFNITVTATDSNGCTGSRNYTLVIICAVITVNPPTISAGTAGTTYGPATFTQTGGLGTITFGETGALPTGLTFTAGTISGTPLQTGSFSITVTATDQNGCIGSLGYTLLIYCPVITINQAAIPAGTAGSTYPNTTFTQTGGIGTATFSESGTLPTGITFSGGMLSGTPLQTGSFPITITATDQNGCTGSRGYTLVINCQAIAVGPSTIPPSVAGVAYPTVNFSQTGGIGAVTFGESGALPSGMTLSGGVLAGTPLQTGTFTISVTATDRNGCTGTQRYSLLINCPAVTVNPSAMPTGVAGIPYTATQLIQTGGVGPIAYSETGTLPPGLSLTNGGLLSGTPLKTGSFPITVTATDRNGCAGSRNYTLVINCPVITVSPGSLPPAVQYTLYNPVQFSETGGVGLVTFSSASVLPSGMTLSSAGVLSGTPTQAGSFPLTVVATDANGCTGSATTTLVVTALDKCLKDDNSAKLVQFNSTTGAYLFTVCGPYGLSVTGKGTLTVVNSIITITDNKPDHRLLIQYNKATLTGRATLTQISAPGVSQSFTVNDTNPNPVCVCGA